MELWSFVAPIGRRWRLLVPALALTLVVCLAVVLTAEPNYEVGGSVVVLLEDQQTNASGKPVNPWFSADAAASQFASLMIDAVTGRDFEDRVAREGVPKTFTIKTDPARPAVVTLTVTARSEAQALESYGKLAEAFRKEVEARQTALRAPEETRYSAIDLTVPREAKAVATRVKLAIGLAGAGVLLSLALAAVAELVSAVRRARVEHALGRGLGVVAT